MGTVRWGLVPWFARSPDDGPRSINARAENVATRPPFRAAFRRRRCLVTADGFCEWRREGGPASPSSSACARIARWVWRDCGSAGARPTARRCSPAWSSRARRPGGWRRSTIACRSSSIRSGRRWLDPNPTTRAAACAPRAVCGRGARALSGVAAGQLAAERLAGVPAAGARSMKSTTALQSSSKRAMLHPDPVVIQSMCGGSCAGILMPSGCAARATCASRRSHSAPGCERVGTMPSFAAASGRVPKASRSTAACASSRVGTRSDGSRQAVQRRVDRVRRLPGGIEADREPRADARRVCERDDRAGAHAGPRRAQASNTSMASGVTA